STIANDDAPVLNANQATVCGSSSTSGRAPIRNDASSSSLPGAASSRTIRPLLTMPPSPSASFGLSVGRVAPAPVSALSGGSVDPALTVLAAVVDEAEQQGAAVVLEHRN